MARRHKKKLYLSTGDVSVLTGLGTKKVLKMKEDGHLKGLHLRYDANPEEPPFYEATEVVAFYFKLVDGEIEGVEFPYKGELLSGSSVNLREEKRVRQNILNTMTRSGVPLKRPNDGVPVRRVVQPIVEPEEVFAMLDASEPEPELELAPTPALDVLDFPLFFRDTDRTLVALGTLKGLRLKDLQAVEECYGRVDETHPACQECPLITNCVNARYNIMTHIARSKEAGEVELSLALALKVEHQHLLSTFRTGGKRKEVTLTYPSQNTRWA